MVLSSGPLHGKSGCSSAFSLTVKLTTFDIGWENSVSMLLSFSTVPGVLDGLLLLAFLDIVGANEPHRDAGGDVTRRVGPENGGCDEEDDEESRRSMMVRMTRAPEGCYSRLDVAQWG